MTAAGLACAACGTELPANSKFCNECGAPVPAGTEHAEYKQVTVLFADVVHSMDIASAVGAERLREIMTELVERSAAVVRRYGGTVDKFTGDGIMAVFGAPAALEDHAVRACLAALAIQEEAKRLAGEVRDRDTVELWLRVGLNSGQVIAGEIGSGHFGYTAVGEQVGMAQRMESVAPPAGVMLSASTARLVEGAAALGESELVQIKGGEAPVPARRLLGLGEKRRGVGRAESKLVGRRREMSTVEGLLDRAIDGHGAVVATVGSPGIGKSRLVREVAAIARRRNVEVFTTFCESHATDVPFRVVARLLRTATGVEGLDAVAARAQVRARVRDADTEDLALFDDLLGIADPDVALPKIDPDARRRRLTALVNGASLARQASTVYVIEDAHWIDEVSESMLAEFLTVIPQTPSLMLVTYRPEYRGALTRVADAHTIALAPLSDSVIGSKFSRDLLETLTNDPVLDDLVGGELIDQITFTADPAYVFHHPLVRTVAYEAQLKSDRAELHRRVAAAIESRDPTGAEENAALIAEHLEAAGDLRFAYGWHMRSATWATNRDINAARLSWERARRIADALPADGPNRAAMRIAPRTMLCGTSWRAHMSVAGARFDELRELCTVAGDKASLAIAMAGLVVDHTFQSRMREGSRLASEAWALAEVLGDPTLTVGLSFPVIYAKVQSTEYSDALRWSQRVIDLADGDPSRGNFLFGSPLALAFTSRAMARYWLGRPGWREDLRDGLAMARRADPMSYVTVVGYAYGGGIPFGVLWPDDSVLREIEDALRIAERSGDDLALTFARLTLGFALVHRPAVPEHDRGQKLLAEVSEALGEYNMSELSLVKIYLARERARRGDRDDAISTMRDSVDHLFREGQLLGWGVPATGVLVETLLDRGAENDVAEAKAAIERLASAPADEGLVIRDIRLLRLRALLARARGDEAGYRDYRDLYRDMATDLGFEGHIKWAEAMP